jgi:putative DNA primase/helicase
MPTKDKKAIVKYKDDDTALVDYKTASKFREFAGMLAPGVMLADFDDEESSRIALEIIKGEGIKTRIIKTTRGIHALFENKEDDPILTNKIHTNTAVGLVMDVKIGDKNGYHIIKFDGVEREVLMDSDELAPLPKWLYPVKNSLDFAAMDEGSGRNQALFNYILTLQSAGFTKEQIRETVRIINTYVLKEPLAEREIETILRDESFKKQSFFKKGKFLHADFAKFLVIENHIVKIGKALHIYADGMYKGDQDEIEAAMIRHLPDLTQSMRREAMAYIKLIAREVEMSPPNFIALGNGIYDIETDQLLNYDPSIVIKNRIPVSYVPGTKDKTLDAVLNKMCCQDKEVRMLLEEVIGYILMRRNKLGKFFILTGGGSNGKSTFLDLIKDFLKPENYSSLGLEEIDRRFKTPEMFGKLANLGDDISNKYIEETAVLKKSCTGETLNVERKGQDPFEFENYAKLIFSANDIPRINDLSEGLRRRLEIIPFNARFKDTDADFDPSIGLKLKSQKVMEALLCIGIEGLKRVLAKNKFTEPEVVKRAKAQYEIDNNPLLTFVEDVKIVNEPVRDVYMRYDLWCHQSNLRPLSLPSFGRELGKQGYKSKSKKIDGKSIRIYVTD